MLLAKVTVSLFFLQRIDKSPLGNVFKFNFQKQPPGNALKKNLNNFAVLTGKYPCWRFFLTY